MPRIINLPTFADQRGNLTAYDPGNSDLPFIPKRIFWIYDVPSDMERADHAHEICEQIIIPLVGEFVIEIDGSNKYYLRTHSGLYIETGCKIRLYDFSEGAICLVLASDMYDEKEAMSKTELFELINEIREKLSNDKNAEKTLIYLMKLLDSGG